MNTEEQKQFISAVKAATHGMPKDDKRRAQELMLAGACLVLDVTAPPEWKSLLMIGRAHKLFGR
jgi:hypothetical protein